MKFIKPRVARAAAGPAAKASDAAPDPAQASAAGVSASPLGRRQVVIGAGVAGAAALAAHSLPRAPAPEPAAVAASGAAAATQGDGYRLTPHVLRYYETTKA